MAVTVIIYIKDLAGIFWETSNRGSGPGAVSQWSHVLLKYLKNSIRGTNHSSLPWPKGFPRMDSLRETKRVGHQKGKKQRGASTGKRQEADSSHSRYQLLSEWRELDDIHSLFPFHPHSNLHLFGQLNTIPTPCPHTSGALTRGGRGW